MRGEPLPIGKLSAVAGRQLGLFTRSDAATIRITSAQLRRLVERGTIERVTPRVFRFAASARSWHQSVLAACLDGGAECLASHRTAAALHGFDGFRPDVIEVLVPMHVRHQRTNAIVHHTRVLTAADRTLVGVIPTTSRARTLIDLGAVAPPERVEEAFDGAERAGMSRHFVETRYQQLRAPGRNGIGAMTQIVRRRLATERIPRSVLERKMRRLLTSFGLPLPVGRYWVKMPSGAKYEIDFAYVDRHLALEVDGHGSHATRSERAADHLRANELEEAGWTIRRFTYEQVEREPGAVASTVRSALSASSPRFDVKKHL